MNIQKITITKQQFDLFPEKEKVLFILLGHLTNEVSILSKFITFSENKSELDVINKAYFTQKSIVARMFIGKLHEGWRMLENNFFGSKLSKKYECKLPSSGQEALQNLKRYFGAKNLISDIRNNFSFHCPSSDEIKSQLKAIPNETEFKLFIGNSYTTTNYHMAEEVVLNTMLNYIKKTTLQEALNEIFNDLSEVSAWFIGFSGHCMVVLLDEFVGNQKEKLKSEIMEVEEQGSLKETTIPFFVKE